MTGAPQRPQYPIVDPLVTLMEEKYTAILKVLEGRPDGVAIGILGVTAGMIFLRIKDRSLRHELFDGWVKTMRQGLDK